MAWKSYFEVNYINLWFHRWIRVGQCLELPASDRLPACSWTSRREACPGIARLNQKRCVQGLYFIFYLFSSKGHMNVGVFYNDKSFKLDHFMAHLWMQDQTPMVITFLNLQKWFVSIFYCCKQSLNSLLLPPVHQTFLLTFHGKCSTF